MSYLLKLTKLKQGYVINLRQFSYCANSSEAAQWYRIHNLKMDYRVMASKMCKWIYIKLRESKFGMALVVTSSTISGGYVLGFKIDPEEKLHTIHKELTSLYTIYSNNPIYGVEYNWSSAEDYKQDASLIDDMEEGLDDPRGEMSNTLTMYLADEGHMKDREPVFNSDIGLAVEHLKDGFTLQKLWEVIPSDKI